MFRFGKKFCAASLSFLALSFNCAPKTNAASSLGILNIISGALGCALGVTGIAFGTFGLVKANGGNDLIKANSGNDDEQDKIHNMLLCMIGGALLIPGVANICSGLAANNKKKNINELNDELKKVRERLDKLENKSVG